MPQDAVSGQNVVMVLNVVTAHNVVTPPNATTAQNVVSVPTQNVVTVQNAVTTPGHGRPEIWSTQSPILPQRVRQLWQLPYVCCQLRCLQRPLIHSLLQYLPGLGLLSPQPLVS